MAAKDAKQARETGLKKPKSGFMLYLSRLWHFIWYDDSAWSWIVNVILAYLIIKFIFYPCIGLLMGTNYPIVAVVSTSMVHTSEFGQWWQQNEDFYLGRNITQAQFENYPFKNGFNKGDLMLLMGKKPKDINVGDIIVFQSKKPYPIIHRVIESKDKGLYVFQTKGDNNKAQIRDFDLDETQVIEKQLLGKAVFRIPWLGYIKIWFVEGLRMVGINAAG